MNGRPFPRHHSGAGSSTKTNGLSNGLGARQAIARRNYSLPGQVTTQHIELEREPRRVVPQPQVTAPTSEAFEGLSAAVVALPEVRAHRASVAAGSVIVDADAPADEVFYVHRGQVRLYQLNPGRDPADDLDADPQGQRLVAVLKADQWFGTAALGGLDVQGLRAVAHTDAVVSRVRADRLRSVLAAHPSELLRVVGDLAAQQRLTHDAAGSTMFDDCHGRLLNALVRLAETAGEPAGDGKLNLRVTHMQLAQYIGVARETVSLALGEFRRKGLLATGRNRLTFDPAAIREARDARLPLKSA